MARVECHGFDGEQARHRAAIFTSGGNVQLVGADADRVIAALENFAGQPSL